MWLIRPIAKQMPATPHKAILSLGSNLGDRAGWLRKATDALKSCPEIRITGRSSLYETEPVEVPERYSDDLYLNSVVLIETVLSPEQLSDAIHQIEDDLQRTRKGPNQPRTIDIDMIAFDQLISEAPELTLPHPRAHLRRFVLQPLAELAPDIILPGQKANVSELLKVLPVRPAVTRYRNLG